MLHRPDDPSFVTPRTDPSPWWPRILALAVLYWIAAFIGTHLPAENLPADTPPDKFLHFAAYGGLAFLLGWSEVLRCGTSLTLYPRILAVLMLYAAFDEWSQTLVSGRDGDVMDWVADACGSAMGVMAVAATSSLRRKAEHREPRVESGGRRAES